MLIDARPNASVTFKKNFDEPIDNDLQGSN